MTKTKNKVKHEEARLRGDDPMVVAGATTGRVTSTMPNMEDVPKSTLPRSLAAALPAAVEIMKHVAAIERHLPDLETEMERAKKGGAIPLARSFVVLHKLREALLSEKDNRFKRVGALFQKFQKQEIPALFEQDGVDNVPLAEGFRVGVSNPFYASIKKDMKPKAYQWLRANGLGDLISDTVNASSLSSALKAKIEDENLEAPEDIFTAQYVPGATVTKT